jgi:mannose-1-phosphate guanylyltransferase
VRAVVLVGGEGTRLRPLTYTTPKQLLPVAGVPMIERVLANLAVGGVDEVILSMGYRPDAFFEAYPDGTCAGFKLTYVVEPEPRDTAGGVAYAAEQAGLDEAFLVVNGDVITDLDVRGVIDFHSSRAGKAEATITLTPVEDPSPFGVVPTDEDGRVLEFIEKPAPGTAPTNMINAGTYVLEPSVVKRIPKGMRVSIERDTFPQLVAAGTLYAFGSDVYWTDTGTPSLYLEANLHFLGDPTGSWIDPTASVHPEAVVNQSVLLSGATVEAGARVERSMVGHRATISAGASVTDLSVIGDDTVVEAGAALENAKVPAPGP